MTRSKLVLIAVETLLVAGAVAGSQRAPVRAAPVQRELLETPPIVAPAPPDASSPAPRPPPPICTGTTPVPQVCLLK